jgi:predicted Zn-dependent protease
MTKKTNNRWEQDAEQRCESLITEAMLTDPENPEVLQTLASVRLSQAKLDDARSALVRSMAIWTDLEPEHPLIPDFSNRVSLARLLMEAEMEEEAMDVLDRLALEDDQSVEACYLGGWCLQLMADKKKKAVASSSSSSATDAQLLDNPDSEQAKDLLAMLRASRSWLLNTLRLYKVLDYEDERLKQHTQELVDAQCQLLGPPPEEGKEDDEVDEWEGIGEDDDDHVDEDDGDEEMAGM